ncbi:MAG: hypothetical protein IPP26_04445 [Flavobacteriales bacterium]|nr:hypothetical protein [Flavobacteriales bacterium]
MKALVTLVVFGILAVNSFGQSTPVLAPGSLSLRTEIVETSRPDSATTLVLEAIFQLDPSSMDAIDLEPDSFLIKVYRNEVLIRPTSLHQERINPGGDGLEGSSNTKREHAHFNKKKYQVILPLTYSFRSPTSRKLKGYALRHGPAVFVIEYVTPTGRHEVGRQMIEIQ